MMCRCGNPLALCGSRKTGEGAGGLVVFEHPRKQGT